MKLEFTDSLRVITTLGPSAPHQQKITNDLGLIANRIIAREQERSGESYEEVMERVWRDTEHPEYDIGVDKGTPEGDRTVETVVSGALLTDSASSEPPPPETKAERKAREKREREAGAK